MDGFRKTRCEVGRVGTLLNIHRMPFSSNSLWKAVSSLDLEMDSGATATSQPAGLGSYRKPGCTMEQTVHTHTVCIYLFTWLETILLESRWTLTSACCCTPYLPNAGLTGTDHHTLLKIQFVSLQNQSLDKMENFPCHSKNNQQEEMKRVA